MKVNTPLSALGRGVVPRIEQECKRIARKRATCRRTPTVIQMEAVECGAAALGIILAHYGRFVALEELRVTCGVSRDGSTAKSVLDAATSYGLEGRGRRMEIPELIRMERPVIIFWAFQHFMVVNGFERRGGRTVAMVNDPATGPRRMTLTEFDEGFTGVVLDLQPGPKFERAGHPERLLTLLMDRLSNTGRGLSLALLAAVVLVIPGLMVPVLTQYFIDSVYGTDSFLAVLPLLLACALCTAATLILTQQQTLNLRFVEARTALVSADRFMYRLLRLPISFFAQRRAGELGRRLSSNATVAQTVTRDLVVTAVNLLLIAVYGVALLLQDLLLGVLAIGVALVNLAVLRAVMRQRIDTSTALEAEESRLAVTTLHTISSIESVKAAGTEHASFIRWSGFMAKAISESQRLGVATALLTVVPPALATLNSGLVMLVGGLRVADGAITVGLLFAFQTLLTSFTRPLTQLTNQAGQLQELGAQLHRLRDAERYGVDRSFEISASATKRLTGNVSFRDVTFSFGPLMDPLIEGLSLDVAPGMRVALVGASGSGKSTVGKLAAGLLEPLRGDVTFDGLHRLEWSRQSMAASVSYVDQSTTLFEGSVRDNICFWDNEIPDEAVVAALRDAEVLDIVSRRAGGMNAHVAEAGKNFSGGQRQRLELARALVTDPNLLILDEATSALDTVTERAVMDNLRRRGCALLVIAHRLSTVRDADLILVMESGLVVESGRHCDLVIAGGEYQKLIESEKHTASLEES